MQKGPPQKWRALAGGVVVRRARTGRGRRRPARGCASPRLRQDRRSGWKGWLSLPKRREVCPAPTSTCDDACVALPVWVVNSSLTKGGGLTRECGPMQSHDLAAVGPAHMSLDFPAHPSGSPARARDSRPGLSR